MVTAMSFKPLPIRFEARDLPHNLEMEQALVGAAMRSNEMFEIAAETGLAVQDFYAPEHQRIWAAVAAVIDQGQQARPQAILHYFAQDRGVEAAGGADYLFELVATSPCVPDLAAHWAGQLRDLARRRALMLMADQMIGMARHVTPDGSAAQVMEWLDRELLALADAGAAAKTSDIASIAAEVEQLIDIRARGGAVGMATPWHDLNRILAGMQGGDLIIVAGRPSMGKSTFAFNLAFRKAHEGAGVLIFSLEMGAGQVVESELARITGIPTQPMEQGRLNAFQTNQVMQASGTLKGLAVEIDDTGGASVSYVRSAARRCARRMAGKGQSLGLIVVDYLQLMGTGGEENRHLALGAITKGLKSLAKELGLPIIVLSQLSRALEAREDKRPQLSDLRESGSIEEDADVVMGLFREEYYLSRTTPAQRANETTEKFMERHERHEARLAECRGVAEVLILKQRRGPIGTAALHFEGAAKRFTDLDVREDE